MKTIMVKLPSATSTTTSRETDTHPSIPDVSYDCLHTLRTRGNCSLPPARRICSPERTSFLLIHILEKVGRMKMTTTTNRSLCVTLSRGLRFVVSLLVICMHPRLFLWVANRLVALSSFSFSLVLFIFPSFLFFLLRSLPFSFVPFLFPSISLFFLLFFFFFPLFSRRFPQIISSFFSFCAPPVLQCAAIIAVNMNLFCQTLSMLVPPSVFTATLLAVASSCFVIVSFVLFMSPRFVFRGYKVVMQNLWPHPPPITKSQ